MAAGAVSGSLYADLAAAGIDHHIPAESVRFLKGETADNLS